MRDAVCKACGKSFVDTSSRRHQTYCSAKCRYAARKERDREKERANPELREARLALVRERYAANPGPDKQRAARWREKNPEKSRLVARVWKLKNPSEVARQDASYRKRRNVRAAKANDGTAHLIIPVLLKLKHCQYCGHRFQSDSEKRIDHRHPLALGGLHSVANLEVCCGTCNGRKHAMPFEQWLTTLNEPWATKARRRAEKANGGPIEQLSLFMQPRPKENQDINPVRAEREAVRAWRQWLQEQAPDWWLDGYWANHPRPWNDHRLQPKHKAALRYKLDPGYRDYHIRRKPSRQTERRYPHSRKAQGSLVAMPMRVRNGAGFETFLDSST